jgi:Mor family transcriptional regulator
MELSKRQIGQLKKIIETAQTILADANKKSQGRAKASGSAPARAASSRRNGKELIAFRKEVRAERKNGVPVAEIAKRYKVSTAYIYQL